MYAFEIDSLLYCEIMNMTMISYWLLFQFVSSWLQWSNIRERLFVKFSLHLIQSIYLFIQFF